MACVETASRQYYRTFAKYLQTVSEAAPRSWLKGQAAPAWQAPCRKNLQGTWEVSVKKIASQCWVN